MSVVTGDARRVAVIGGGPAGLMAAEGLAARGYSVDVYDAMPSVGRKFLMAGRGGLNLTHSEPAGPFLARYGDRAAQVAPWLARMDAAALRDWAHGLGVRTFVGTSGRVFPEMKAAPLLRAGWRGCARPACAFTCGTAGWAGRGCGGRRRGSAFRYARGRASRLGRCRRAGPGRRQLGPPRFRMAPGRRACARALPWRRCGRPMRVRRGLVGTFPRERYAGQPVKPVSMRCGDDAKARQGEFVVTRSGIEQPGLCAVGGVARSPAGRWPRDRGAGSAADWPQEK